MIKCIYEFNKSEFVIVVNYIFIILQREILMDNLSIYNELKKRVGCENKDTIWDNARLML